MEEKECIREIALTLGADVCGFANIDRLATNSPVGFSPTDVYKECHTAVVIGVALPKGLSLINPQLIYCYFNGNAVPMVDSILLHLAKEIEKKLGGYAVPIPCDLAGSWNEETKTAHGILSMKHLAVQAGLGFMGKNTILCNPTFGNLMTVGTVLISHNLESDAMSPNLCPPKCHICIDNCPAHAISENGTVNQKRCREHAYSTTFRGYATVECNLCRMKCPLRYGKK